MLALKVGSEERGDHAITSPILAAVPTFHPAGSELADKPIDLLPSSGSTVNSPTARTTQSRSRDRWRRGGREQPPYFTGLDPARSLRSRSWRTASASTSGAGT